MKVRNQQNGYTVSIYGLLSTFMTFMFGPLWFIAYGNWRNAAIHMLVMGMLIGVGGVAIMFAVLFHIVISFLSYWIEINHYEREGWEIVEEKK